MSAGRQKCWLYGAESGLSEFTKLRPLLHSAIKEVKEFSKKKPDGVMSALKVRLLNRLLEQLKTAMAAGPATEYLDLLDEDSLPDYSDAVLILSRAIVISQCASVRRVVAR